MMIVSKWKCEICEKEFENFHAQGFDSKIYCPLCFFKEKTNRLEKENARLKDKLKDIKKILDADCCVENIYQAMCQYLNIHDFELNLEDYLKENQAIIKNIKINDKIII